MKLNKGTSLFTLVAGFVSLWTMVARAKTCTGVFTDNTTHNTFTLAVSSCFAWDSCSCQAFGPQDYSGVHQQGQAQVTCYQPLSMTTKIAYQYTGNDSVVVSSCSSDVFASPLATQSSNLTQ